MSKQSARGGDATIRFTYQSAFNQITNPTSYASLSMYFITHWMPKISPNGLRILLALRSLGYYNPKAQAARGEIDIEQPELAALSGVKLRTLQRTFADDEVLNKYVRRVFQVKRDANGRILKEHYVYVVTMDDILTPEDEIRLAEMLEEPDKNQDENQGDTEETPTRQNGGSVKKPTRQNGGPVCQTGGPTRQNDVPTRQNGGSYNKVIHTLTTLNTSDTPAARPEFLTSSVSEQDFSEQIGAEPIQEKPLPFAALSAGEQAPWLDAAEQELRQSFGLEAWLKTGEKARAGIRRQRAASLYQVEQKVIQ